MFDISLFVNVIMPLVFFPGTPNKKNGAAETVAIATVNSSGSSVVTLESPSDHVTSDPVSGREARCGLNQKVRASVARVPVMSESFPLTAGTVTQV